jgi:hypothetical protein
MMRASHVNCECQPERISDHDALANVRVAQLCNDTSCHRSPHALFVPRAVTPHAILWCHSSVSPLWRIVKVRYHLNEEVAVGAPSRPLLNCGPSQPISPVLLIARSISCLVHRSDIYPRMNASIQRLFSEISFQFGHLAAFHNDRNHRDSADWSSDARLLSTDSRANGLGQLIL